MSILETLPLFSSVAAARQTTGAAFVVASTLPEGDLATLRIVLPAADEASACAGLERGAAQVLLGSAALADNALIARLAERFGSERVGVFVPVRRAAVSWSLDTHTNADFSCMVTATPVPRWEVTDASGASTGTDALWWTEQMLQAGASSALVSAPVAEGDLLLCAELVERLGDRLWLTPADAGMDPTPWVSLVGARRLALPSPWQEPQRLAMLAQAAAMREVA